MTTRRDFLNYLEVSGLCLSALGCNDAPPQHRYNSNDLRLLANRRLAESANSGKGPFGTHRYQGYKGLADLPGFELDQHQNLILAKALIVTNSPFRRDHRLALLRGNALEFLNALN